MEAWGPRNKQDRTWAVIDAVGAVATEAGVTSAQVALAWVGAQPAVTSVILGARTVEQLTDNLAAADLDLSTDQLARLSEVSAPQADDYPYGVAGVGQRQRDCQPRAVPAGRSSRAVQPGGSGRRSSRVG